MAIPHIWHRARLTGKEGKERASKPVVHPGTRLAGFAVKKIERRIATPARLATPELLEAYPELAGIIPPKWRVELSRITDKGASESGHHYVHFMQGNTPTATHVLKIWQEGGKVPVATIHYGVMKHKVDHGYAYNTITATARSAFSRPFVVVRVNNAEDLAKLKTLLENARKARLLGKMRTYDALGFDVNL